MNRRQRRAMGPAARPSPPPGRDPAAAFQARIALVLEHHAAGRLAAAEAVCRELCRAHPALADVHHMLAVVLRDQRKYAAAEAACLQALALRDDLFEVWQMLGKLQQYQGRPAEAVASFDRALHLKPGSADGQLNRAMALLLAGDFRPGWEAYEARWEASEIAPFRRTFAQPRWDGTALAGRTVLLHAEQGLGDTLQFVRYVTPAAQRGGRVILEVQPELKRLLAGFPGAAQVVALGEALPPFDCQCPLMSLPLLFGTTLDSIPAETPYVAADPARAAAWAARLGAAAPAGLRIGIVWAGSPRKGFPEATAIDRRRSMPFATLARLGKVPGVTLVSLQKGEAAAQAAAAPAGLRFLDWSGELHDFTDTAALVAALDLVVTVDTAVAHLAGAMAKPVWVLSRYDGCWRWLLGRDDSPWYPTLRLFRQRKPGDWSEVAGRVAAALAALVAGRR